MTHLVMDEQPARPPRWPIYLLVVALLALGALLFWAWKVFVPAQEEQTSPEAPAQEAVATSETPSSAAQPTPAATIPTPAPAVAPAASEEAQALLADATQLQAEGKWQAAREKGQEVLTAAKTDDVRTAAETLVGKAGIELLFTPRPMPEKVDYTVQPNDSLDKIARQYGTTVELLQKSNNLRGSIIHPGDRLRVFTGKWSIRVNKTRNDLVLLLNDQFFKRYRVGTGEYAKTPVGEFKIVDRIAQPTWWHPDGRTIPYGDPENLLGTHWLALDVKGYGIHGTWEPDTIGKQSSMGCVRLLNEDVAELFTLVTIGTPVVIEE